MCSLGPAVIDHRPQRSAKSHHLRTAAEISTRRRRFLLRIETGDESWFHHFEPETKRQSMEWHHLHSPSKKKAKTVPSAAKLMGTAFWDAEGLILAEFLERGQTTLLLVMSRHCTSSVVHCAINVRDETSSPCMTTLAPTPFASYRKQLQRCGGKFFHTPPTDLIWQPPTPSFRICEGSAAWTTL